jgi:protein-disulfide isomerase
VLRKTILCLVCIFAGPYPLHAQASSKEKPSAPKASAPSDADQDPLQSRVEKYLRNLYAWGPSFDVKVGPTKPSPVADLLEVPVTVSIGSQSDTATVYVTKNGNFLIRGELSDMSADPFVAVRSKLHPGNSPAMGPKDAKITLIEFADFECPSCRQLDLILRDFMPHHPEIRLVFKHYPLTDIHPWAMTAAIASQCAFHQDPSAFWKIHDAIFDAQDEITPSNVWDKMLALGNQLGLNADTYRACMTSPDTSEEIKQTIEEGHSVGVTATPTTFVNARRVVGPDKSLLEQYMLYDPGA